MENKTALLQQLRIDRPPPAPEQPKRWRWVLGALVLVLAALGGWLILGQDDRPLVQVAIARPASTGGANAQGASLLDASGYVVARRQATVAAKITGKVVELLIEEGQHVDEGQVLARLDDSNTQAALAQAQAQLAQAQAAREAAQTAFDDIGPIFARNRTLAAKGWVSQDALDTSRSSYDQARTSLAVAGSELEVAKRGLEVAQRNQDDTIVRAPFAGVVTVKAAQPGEMVSPISAGGGFTRTGIGTLVDMDSLELEIDVSENFINRVHAGQLAAIKLNAYPDWSIPGTVIAVIPTADRSKATVKVRVGFKQKDPRILPEMGARVAFLSDAPATEPGAQAHALVVPSDAVQANGDTGTVFLVKDDRVERRAVRLGARTGDGQIIMSGLTDGARLVVGDLSQLKDNDRIRIKE